MTGLPWDPEGKYDEGLLRRYEHWTLGVHFRQRTLGSYVILANRAGLERFSDLSAFEMAELLQVMTEIEGALLSSDTFKPDRFNYEQLGNEMHHLHFHGTPRYANARTFAGREWVDEAYGSPSPWPERDVSPDVVREVRSAIEPLLPP